jgi:hypothetical protein
MTGPVYRTLKKWDEVTSSDEQIDGDGIFFGLEGGVNLSIVGILLSYQYNFVRHNFSSQIYFNSQFSPNPLNIEYNRDVSWETAGVGFRFFNSKGGRTDLQFTLSQFDMINLFKYEDYNRSIYPGVSFVYVGNPVVTNSIVFRLNMNLTPKDSPVYSGISNIVGSLLFDL